MPHYTLLSQEDEGVSPPTPFLAKEESHVDIHTAHRGGLHIHLSPLTINLILALALVVSIACLAFTTREVTAVFEELQGYLDFTDIRNLPLPDQYNGKEGLFTTQ